MPWIANCPQRCNPLVFFFLLLGLSSKRKIACGPQLWLAQLIPRRRRQKLFPAVWFSGRLSHSLYVLHRWMQRIPLFDAHRPFNHSRPFSCCLSFFSVSDPFLLITPPYLLAVRSYNRINHILHYNISILPRRLPDQEITLQEFGACTGFLENVFFVRAELWWAQPD